MAELTWQPGDGSSEDRLSLADWRRRMAALYVDVRAMAASDPAIAVPSVIAGRIIARSESRGKTRRSAVIAELKSAPCLDCHRQFPPECMDFDHVRGAKAREIADLRSGTLARLLEEIAKCDLVCANCHRIRTRARQRNGRVAQGIS
mgnify:CR=1 FL=1